MIPRTAESLEHRFLVLAPTGSDAANTHSVLAKVDVLAFTCQNAVELCREIERGAGAVLIAEEAIDTGASVALTKVLSAQPAWSDLPILLMPASSDVAENNSRLVEAFGAGGNVSLLERPFQVVTLLTAVRAALRARRRQYEVRNLIIQRDNFLAMLGHELRNPLAPLRNGLTILRAPATAEQHRKAMDIAERQVLHLSRLVDDLLDVARISRGKVLLKKERIDFAGLVRLVIEDNQKAFEETGLQLDQRLTSEPLWVQGDQTRLSQAISNIIHNSLKYTDHGGAVRITLQPEGGFAVLSIQDTGIGMDSEMLTRLFEPFSQADGTLARSRGGLGIGLALVKGFMDMHGGSVTAKSAGLKQGTEFVIKLPLEQQQFTIPQMQTLKPHSKTRKRVLIIEDNIDSAESMRLLLELSGHELAVAYSGDEGVLLAQKFNPEVVICDIGLPGKLDGYGVAVLRSDGKLNGVQLIALTGYGQDDDQQRAMKAGFNLHLTKPVDPDKLIGLLSSAAGRHQVPASVVSP